MAVLAGAGWAPLRIGPGPLPAAPQDAPRGGGACPPIRFRQVAPQVVGSGVNVLGEDAEGVAVAEHVGEQAPRLVFPADRGERVDVPELTYEERRFRRAEVIVGRVAHDEAVAVQFFADGL